MHRVRLVPFVLVGAAVALAIGGCGSTTGAKTEAAVPGVPAPVPPWSVVASAELGGGATAGPLDITFFRDGTGEVYLGEEAKPEIVRFTMPTGQSSALTLLPTTRRGTASPSQGGTAIPSPAPVPVRVPYGMSQHSDASAATNRAGTTVAAWVEWDEVGETGYHARLRAAFKSRGGYGTPVTLKDSRPYEPYLESVSVDIADDGTAAIVSDGIPSGNEPSGIVAWIGRGADTLDEPLVAAPGAYPGKLDTLITASGSIVIAWEPPQAGEDSHPPTPIRAVALAAGAKAFSPVQLIDPGTDIGYPPDFGLEPGTDGTALLAFNGSAKRGGGEPLLVAKTDTSGRFSSDREELATGEHLGDLVTRADGAAVITSVAEDTPTASGPGSAFTLLPEGRQFGAREALPLPTSPSEGVGAPPASFDPKTGRPAIAYVLPATKTRKARLVVVVRDDPRALAPDPRDP